VVPYSLQFLIMDLTVLRGMFKVSDIVFINKPWSVLLHNFVPVWRAPSWCPLLRGVADSGAFQNRCRCFYTCIACGFRLGFSTPLWYISWCKKGYLNLFDLCIYTKIMLQIMCHLDCTQVNII
jgi:hypothetical protein